MVPIRKKLGNGNGPAVLQHYKPNNTITVSWAKFGLGQKAQPRYYTVRPRPIVQFSLEHWTLLRALRFTKQ